MFLKLKNVMFQISENLELDVFFFNFQKIGFQFFFLKESLD